MSDTDSSIRHLFDLVRREQVTPFVRIIAAGLSVSMGFLGYGPLFDGDQAAYDRPIFDGVFAFASPAAWGLWFTIGGALLILTAITGRAVVYLVAVAVSTGALAAWSAMIIIESRINDAAVLTSGAIGLGVGTLVALAGLPFSPRQLAVARPILAVAEETGETTKLRRIG